MRCGRTSVLGDVGWSDKMAFDFVSLGECIGVVPADRPSGTVNFFKWNDCSFDDDLKSSHAGFLKISRSWLVGRLLWATKSPSDLTKSSSSGVLVPELVGVAGEEWARMPGLLSAMKLFLKMSPSARVGARGPDILNTDESQAPEPRGERVDGDRPRIGDPAMSGNISASPLLASSFASLTCWVELFLKKIWDSSYKARSEDQIRIGWDATYVFCFKGW